MTAAPAAQPPADPLVLWVAPVGELGGVARHLLDVARVGVPGFRVWFLVPPGPLADRLRELGAAVLVGDLGPEFGVRTSLRTLRATVRRLRPAIVHTHLAYADIVAAAATVGLPVRLVSTEHGIAGDTEVYHGAGPKKHVRAVIHTLRTRRFAALIAVAEATAQAMRRLWHVREVTVIRNGVDPVNARAGAPEPRPAGVLRVASLARLAPEKRLDVLLDAFAELYRRNPHATLTVAGEGPLRGRLEARRSALGLDDSVTFPGYVDAATLLAETDVLVQLSVWENSSYALLDAVVAGVGVCATPVGGNPEILPERCLVDASEPVAVAAAIERQADPAERPALPTGWPTVAEMAARTADVYRGVLA